MPSLYIYGDKSHQNYQLISENLTVTKVFGQWEPITSSIECLSNNNCTVQINNNCVGSGKNQINWIVVEATETTAQYLVNCAPDLTYKPFEWGMVLLILFSTVIITISSLYSRAWSYGGIGYDITITFIILFNLLIVGGMVLAYFFTGIAALLMNVLGSVIGTAGAMVCFSESLWLIRWKPF